MKPDPIGNTIKRLTEDHRLHSLTHEQWTAIITELEFLRARIYKVFIWGAGGSGGGSYKVDNDGSYGYGGGGGGIRIIPVQGGGRHIKPTTTYSWPPRPIYTTTYETTKDGLSILMNGHN